MTTKTNSLTLFPSSLCKYITYQRWKVFARASHASSFYLIPFQKERNEEEKLTLVIFDFPSLHHIFHVGVFPRSLLENIKTEIQQKHFPRIFPFTQTQKATLSKNEELCWDKWNFLFGFKAFPSFFSENLLSEAQAAKTEKNNPSAIFEATLEGLRNENWIKLEVFSYSFHFVSVWLLFLWINIVAIDFWALRSVQ